MTVQSIRVDVIHDFWLSFADSRSGKHPGIAIVEVSAAQAEAAAKKHLMPQPHADDPEAPWMAAAIAATWAHGCNSGGEVFCRRLSDDFPDHIPRYRLLQKDDLIKHGIAERLE
jgi:hypothetical protein